MNDADSLFSADDRLNAGCQVALVSLLRGLNPFSQSANATANPVALMINRIKSTVPAIDKAAQTDLEWIMAAAEKMACGVKNSSRDQAVIVQSSKASARLKTLFEQIQLSDAKTTVASHCYQVAPVTPMALFPMAAASCQTENSKNVADEYAQLWDGFLKALADIPAAHQHATPLWLDHLETLWACYTSSIPSTAASDVSLYDYSKTVAALAVALWRYHHDLQHQPNADWNQHKFLLIQGDCFGIQDFIFATGGETQKRAAKLLRGRSFYVSLLSECAALRVLESIDLPGTSQIINAAGKFLIVAPNTPETIEKLAAVQKQLDDWFLTHTWGQSGIGLAWEAACCNDFLKKGAASTAPFAELIKRLFRRLDEIKLQRFDLCRVNPPAPLFADYLEQFQAHGECQIDGRSPAIHQIGEQLWVSALAADQIAIGNFITHRDRLLITRTALSGKTLATSIFGYFISFTAGANETGWFGPEAHSGNLRRCWDISMPESMNQPLWNECARRAINGYIPRFMDEDEWQSEKYVRMAQDEADFDPHPGEPKTLNHLACEDRQLNDEGQWIGVSALMTLKGDVDNLGVIFQRGLPEPSFARMAALSRQLNDFFAVYLPTLCQSEAKFSNTYTVFAGGDDFFLIGPWHSQIELAARMRQEFSHYVAGNPAITFSAGLAMTKSGLPIHALAELAEEALEQAKRYQLSSSLKNAVCCFSHTVSWDAFTQLLKGCDELKRLAQELKLSMGYLYGLLHLVDMAENLYSDCSDQSGKKQISVENALWHSRFAYRTRRMLERQKGMDEPARRRWQQEIAAIIANGGIEKFKGAYKIALFSYLYQQRN